MPVPQGANPGAFGRFITDGDAVQALWATQGARDIPGEAVEQTADGGRSWTPGRLACPSAGACVVWGPAPNGLVPALCTAQTILLSPDRGATWTEPRGLEHVCYIGTGPVGPYELAALSADAVALIGDGQPPETPLLLSRDGGRTWAGVTLPPLPGPTALPGPGPFPGLQLLPSGALAVPGWRLAPEASGWSPLQDPAGPGGTA